MIQVAANPDMACKPNVSKPSSLTSAPRRRVVPARNSTRGRVACHLLSSSAGTVRLGMRRAATAAFVVRAAAVEVQRPPLQWSTSAACSASVGSVLGSSTRCSNSSCCAAVNLPSSGKSWAHAL